MAEFPYVTNPSRVVEFLSTIQNVGVPQKVTTKYLESVGFKSSNDRRIIPVLNFIEFIDDNGKPSNYWLKYRNKETAKSVLGSAIQKGYSTLFAVYSDANRKDDEALKNFFTSNTTVGEKAVSFMVGTFKALCGAADFESSDQIFTEDIVPPEDDLPRPITLPKGTAPTININLQITLPETQDGSIYEKIFEAMKKHLLD